MERAEIIEKLKLLGILNSHQLIKKDLNFWYLKKFKEFKNDQEKKIIINEAKENLDLYNKKQLIEVLNNGGSSNEYDKKNKSNNVNDNVNEQKYLNEDTLFSKAFDYFEEKNYKKAKKYFRLSIDSSIFGDLTNQEKANVYSFMGQTLEYLGEYKDSFNAHTAAVKLEPNNALHYYFRSQCSIADQRLNNALDDLNTAVNFNKKDPDIYYQRALVEKALEKYDDALKDIEIAIKINKDPNRSEFKEFKKVCITLSRKHTLRLRL
mgnify:CR=1 FL=1